MNRLLGGAIIAIACVGCASSDDSVPTADLTKAPPSELIGRLDADDHFEAVLQEFIKRGGQTTATLLSELLKKRSAELEPAKRKLETLDNDVDRDGWRKQFRVVDRLQNNLELLTALRRVQKKNDPLQVEVLRAVPADTEIPFWATLSPSLLLELDDAHWSDRLKECEQRLRKAETDLDEQQRLPTDPAAKEVDDLRREVETMRGLDKIAPLIAKVRPQEPLECRGGKLPTLLVALKSADIEGVPVWLTRGGDGSSDHPGRFRIEVTDVDGNTLPMVDNRLGRWGGISLSDFEAPGESWYVLLPMENIVKPVKPGHYSVMVLFHNVCWIADKPEPLSLDGLIVFRSQPFTMDVK